MSKLYRNHPAIIKQQRGGAVVARQTHYLKVAGSSPAPATTRLCGILA